ncbi:hypothetical protein BR93DRAFT_937014 [Coniochaeta sp. PMI_546]|nr:hypothetical protein BR93DRAFT_937014 [Coniochaeta sp. PMI_546]
MSSLDLVDFTVDEVLELASAEEALQTKSNEENTALSNKKHRNDEAIVDLLQVTLDQPAANDVLHSHDETQLKISDMSPHQVSLDAIFPPPESEESEDKPKRTIDYGDAAPQVSKKERIDSSCFTEIPALPDDPWMTAYRRNKQESALCRLPNELTGMIISHLSEESKYILQQSSRRFYGVYSGPGFSHPAPGSGCSAPGSLSSPSLMTASPSMSGVPPQTAVGTSCVDLFFDSVPIHRNRNLTRRYYPGPTVDETGMFRSVPS